MTDISFRFCFLFHSFALNYFAFINWNAAIKKKNNLFLTGEPMSSPASKRILVILRGITDADKVAHFSSIKELLRTRNQSPLF